MKKVKVIKLPYSGCSIIQEEVVRIFTHLYGGAYTASDLNDPLQIGTIGGGGKFDPFSHNFKRRANDKRRTIHQSYNLILRSVGDVNSK